MASILRLDQLVLGPRDGGRNYGVLAASPGLRLPDSAVSAAQAFNMDIGHYVGPGDEIHAVFQLTEPPARELWCVCTTRHYGLINRNKVWGTSGWVLTRADMEALEARPYRLLTPGMTNALPAAGTALPQRTIDATAFLASAGPTPTGSTLSDEESNRAALELTRGGSPAFVIEKPLQVLPTICKILDRTPRSNRWLASFVTAPAPIRDWSFVAFEAELWPEDTWKLPGDYRRLPANARGLGAGVATPTDLQWHALVHVVEENDTRFGGENLASKLVRARRTPEDPAAPNDLSSLLVIALEGQDEAQLRTDFGNLLAAAAFMPPDQRKELAHALFRALQAFVDQSPTPWFWAIECYRARDGAPVSPFEQLGPQPALMARLAVERDMLLKVPGWVIPRLGSSIVSNHAATVLGQIEGEPPLAANDLELLRMAIRTLDGPDGRVATKPLATALASRALAIAEYSPNDVVKGYSKDTRARLVRDLLERCVTKRRSKGMVHLLTRELGDRVRGAFENQELKQLLDSAKRATKKELATRENGESWRPVAFGLALLRAGGRHRGM